MEKEKLLNILKQTLADYRFSRGEKKTIKEFVQHYFSTPHDLAVLRSEAFELAREELLSPQSKQVMDWLEDVLKVMIPSHEELTIESEAVFSTALDRPRIVNLHVPSRRLLIIRRHVGSWLAVSASAVTQVHIDTLSQRGCCINARIAFCINIQSTCCGIR